MALARIDTEPGEKSSPKQGSLFGDDVLSPLRPDELPKTKGQILKEELLRMAKAVYLDRGGNDLVLRGTARFAVQYARRNALKQAVITMRGPTCQLCGFTFRKKSGQFFAESHHIDPVSEGGRDDEPYLLVICANHHRQLHYAEVTWPKGKKRPREVSINGEVLPIRWTEAEPEGA